MSKINKDRKVVSIETYINPTREVEAGLDWGKCPIILS